MYISSEERLEIKHRINLIFRWLHSTLQISDDMAKAIKDAGVGFSIPTYTMACTAENWNKNLLEDAAREIDVIEALLHGRSEDAAENESAED
jgi:hypothetical protein